MFKMLSNNVNGVKNELILFQLSVLPLALFRATTHLRSSSSWDIMGPLPAAGCRYILVVTDLFKQVG